MLLGPHDPNDGPSLWRDLLAGTLGFAPRLALSLTAAVLGVAAMMFCIAFFESSGGAVRDETIAIGLGLVTVTWIGTLLWIWRGYAKFRRVIRATFTCLIIWAVVITLCIVIAMATWQEEFWIAGLIFGGFAGSFAVITAAAYKGSAGRSIVTATGSIHVHCAECGYSLVGKNDCTCPECGRKYTIDELIRLQDYDAIRRPGATAGSAAPGGSAGAHASTRAAALGAPQPRPMPELPAGDLPSPAGPG